MNPPLSVCGFIRLHIGMNELMCRIWLAGTTVVSSSSLFKSQRCLLVRSAFSMLHVHVLDHGGHSHNIAHHLICFFHATLQNVLANIVLHFIFFFSLHRT